MVTDKDFDEWKAHNISRLQTDFCKVYKQDFEQFCFKKFEELRDGDIWHRR